jgi:hypothetical protein
MSEDPMTEIRRRLHERMVSAISFLAPVLLLLPMAACDAGDPPPPASIRDSAGIRIVEHGSDPRLPTWTLHDPPETVIGRESSEAAHQLTQVVGAVRLSDGRIVVGDRGSREARYFDVRGQHLRTVGGAGQGPGEMRFLYAVDLMGGDTLVLGAWPIGSRYWFDPQGEFIRSEVLGPWFPGLLGRTLPDGSLLLDTYEQGSHGNTIEFWAARGEEAFLRPTGVMELVSRDGSEVDTVGLMYGERWMKIGQPPMSFALHALPFEWRSQVAWSRDRLFVGETSNPEVRSYARDGTLLRILRWAPRVAPVTSADRRTFREEVISGLRRPTQAPVYERWLSEATYPESKPAFAQILADAEGTLWVQDSRRSGAASESWTVFGPDGGAVASLEVPSGLRVIHVSRSHVLAIWTDEMDVEYLRSYRIER